MPKAIIVQPGGGYDKVIIGERDAPDPGPGEIKVAIKASSLNFHDFAVVSGIWGPVEPRIPMADGAGEVIVVGAGVTEFKAGDHVVSTFFPAWQDGPPLVDSFAGVPGDGIDGYARDVVTMPVASFTLAPKGYSFAEAATLTTAGLTAWRALFVEGGLKPGETVLVQGTGGVSVFALQFAKMAGAEVIATSSSEAKLEKLKAMGADHLINYKTDPAWGETVRKVTDGVGVDHVVEVGGPATLAQSIIAARIGGHISVIGILSGFAGELNLLPVLMRQLKLKGIVVGNRKQQQEMIAAIDANGVKPVIDKSFAFEEIVAAFQYQETNRHFGKICLTNE